jgi:hypothetical protein
LIMNPDVILVASALAPTVLSRNKNPDLYRDPARNDARKRGRMIRRLGQDLVRLAARKVACERSIEPVEKGVTTDAVSFRYQVAELSLQRTLRLSALEFACLCKLAERTGWPDLQLTGEAKALVDATLQTLLEKPATIDSV